MSSLIDGSQAAIREILRTCHIIAVVGLSSRKLRPGYYVPQYLQAAGYRIIPVNPELEHALGEQAYPDLASVPEQIDLVLIFRRSEYVAQIVRQSIAVGAKAVWMQQGIINETAAEAAQSAGLQVVMDACMMVEHRRYFANR